MGKVVGIVAAVLFHVGFLAFGGILFGKKGDAESKPQMVDLMSEAADAADKKKDQKKDEDVEKTEKKEEIETETEAPPDASEIIEKLDIAAPNDAPALEAASLSAIEAALTGGGSGGGDFGESLSFSSGGRIGGTGKGGVLEQSLESAFSMSEIDQQPRPVFRSTPQYPSDMRGKKIEGVVTILCLVDDQGKVTKPKIERSSHPSFERPALEAVRNWKFEPALKGGKRVGCPVRLPIRFPAN